MHISQALPQPEDFAQLPLHIPEDQIDSYADEWKIESLAARTTYKLKAAKWTEWYAVREFVQNALDETEKVDLLYEDELDISYIVDDGQGMMLRHLFFGEDKGDTPEEIHCLRGRFGEGMKLSLLPLLRNGNKVIIRTIGVDYHFAIVVRQDEGGEFKQIWMLRRPNQISQGTAIAIKGIDCLAYRKNFAPMISKSDPDLVICTIKGGPEEFDACKVRQAFNIPGAMYVRDIYVEARPAFFGYNFWFDDTAEVLGSDRDHIRSWHYFEKEFTYLLRENNQEYIQLLFHKLYYTKTIQIDEIRDKDGSPKTHYKKDMLEWIILEGRDFKQLTESDAINLHMTIFTLVGREFSWSSDIKEQKQLEHHGIRDLRGIFPNLKQLLLKYNLIKDPEDLARATELTTETVIIGLDDVLHSGHADAEYIAEPFKKLIDVLELCMEHMSRKRRGFKDVTLNFYAGNFKEESGTTGFYRVATKQVFIHVDNLTDVFALSRIFIHETAHAWCHAHEYGVEGCEDLAQEFENSLEQVGFMMMELSADHNVYAYDTISQHTQELGEYEREFKAIVEEKILKVQNPLGLVRPPHNDSYGSRDKERLDKTFLDISNGCYDSIHDIKNILWGYSQYDSRYDPSGGRGRNLANRMRMSEEQMMSEDIITLQKLGFSLPVKALNGTLSLKKWVEFIQEHNPRKLNPDLLLENEDWDDPMACWQMVLNTEQPYIKMRNFDRFISLADSELLSMLRVNAPQIVFMKHQQNLDICGNQEPYIIVKEHLFSVADKYDWLDVISLYKTALSAYGREDAVRAYARRGLVDDLLEMHNREDHPRVMLTILHHLRELLDPEVEKSRFAQAGPKFKALLEEHFWSHYDKIIKKYTEDDYEYTDVKHLAREILKNYPVNYLPPYWPSL